MDKFLKYLMLLLITTLSLSVSSCGDDKEEDEPGTNQPDNYQQFKSQYDALLNTSWKLESSYEYYTVGGQDKIQDNMKIESNQKFLPLIVTFSGELNENSFKFKLYYSSVPGYGLWWFREDGTLQLGSSYYFDRNPGNLTSKDVARLQVLVGETSSIIEELTSTKLVLCQYYNGKLGGKQIYRRVYGYDPANPGNDGPDTAVEKPEIGLEDFSSTTSSITLKYRIYNQDVAKVSSAKGYYGTSSPSTSVSATIAGSLITIRINSLKRGTYYYVKCSATGKGGTTTSETTKLSTLY